MRDKLNGSASRVYWTLMLLRVCASFKQLVLMPWTDGYFHTDNYTK